MELIQHYMNPEVFIVSIALYFLGNALKKSEIIMDKYIPLLLGETGVALCAVLFFSSFSITSMKDVAFLVFSAIVQGILAAALSTYVNQLIKQGFKKE